MYIYIYIMILIYFNFICANRQNHLPNNVEWFDNKRDNSTNFYVAGDHSGEKIIVMDYFVVIKSTEGIS